MTHDNGDDNCGSILNPNELEQVAGGRMKIPGTGLERYQVLYDDGISILTTKPGCSNVYPTIT